MLRAYCCPKVVGIYRSRPLHAARSSSPRQDESANAARTRMRNVVSPTIVSKKMFMVLERRDKERVGLSLSNGCLLVHVSDGSSPQQMTS